MHYTFNGIYRSPTGIPGNENQFFKHHQEKCGGSFFKIYEVYRTNRDGTIDYRYVNHHYKMVPEAVASKHLKTTIKPRAIIDLTDESSTPVSMSISTEVIDLDETLEEGGEHRLADEFISKFNRKFSSVENEIKCPICETQVKQKLFVLHLDGCMGISQNVAINFRKFR